MSSLPGNRNGQNGASASQMTTTNAMDQNVVLGLKMANLFSNMKNAYLPIAITTPTTTTTF